MIDATATLLQEAGWSAATHGEVAKRSGYSKATIYAHWPTTLELVRDAVTRICDDATYPERTGDLHMDLHAALRGLAQSIQAGRYARIMAGAIEHASEDAIARELRDRLYESASCGVRRVLSAHVPPQALAPVLSMLVGAVLVRITYEGAVVSNAFLDEIISAALPA